MNLWQQLVTVVRGLPAFIADRSDSFLQDVHHPVDPTNYPDGFDCRSCRRPWPCPEFEAAGWRLHARRP